MLVYCIYCTVVSLLLLSPSIDKPYTCNMSSAPLPRLVHKQFAAICGWESNAFSNISNVSIKFVVVVADVVRRKLMLVTLGT